MGKIAEKLEKIIDIWIHFHELGNYDKVPKIKEYDHLARTLEKHILDAKPKDKDPIDYNREAVNPAHPHNQALKEWEDNLEV